MTKQILVTILVAIIVSFGTYKIASKNSIHTETKTETAFDRVMRTKTLRCGYNTWPPAVTKDANTGKIGGFVPEIIEYAAKSVGIKVEWTQQAGWASYTQDLQNNRYDAMCAGAWAIKEVAPYLVFTRPIFYNPVYAYVRADDHRFDADLKILNDPQYRIGSVDGGISQIIAKDDFPKVTMVGLPQLTDPSQSFIDLAAGKSDLVFMEGSFANEYISKNPDKVRQLSTTPYRSFPSPLIAANINDSRLTTMFDTIIGEMQLQGTITRILNNNKADPNLFIMPVKPY